MQGKQRVALFIHLKGFLTIFGHPSQWIAQHTNLIIIKCHVTDNYRPDYEQGYHNKILPFNNENATQSYIFKKEIRILQW